MLDRRAFLQACGNAGLGSTLLPGALFTLASQAASAQTSAGQTTAPAASVITPQMLEAAAVVAGISMTAEQRAMVLDGVREQRESLDAIRGLQMPNSVAPAMVFDPRPAHFRPTNAASSTPAAAPLPAAPPSVEGIVGNENRLAFASVTELGELLRTRKITSAELTKFYLDRLRRLDGKLHLVITPLTDRALAQAATADREIAAGNYRGPLHGVPWGAKDLLSVKGYPTTWGAGGFEHQTLDEDAEVVRRLDAAGAVLIAKLTLGALAMGDVWFGGKTRNPWNLNQGSSGSSAGSASAVSAGCVGFAIGSETLGSISSPCTRCGVTGLRPTFGFVPRSGAMALSWSMDKLGPIARSVADAALVMAVIHGPDGVDKAVREASFNLPANLDARSLRVGFLEDAFRIANAQAPAASAEKPESEAERKAAELNRARRAYDNRYDRAALDALKQMGVTLTPIKLPKFPYGAVTPVLEVEAAAAFDDLTRSGRDRLLTAQGKDDWPNTFRTARFYSGVDYVQAQRARSLLIEHMAELFRQVDVVVTPTGGAQLVATNLSGHPAVIVPNGLRGTDAPTPPPSDNGEDDNIGGPGTPVSITFLGGLYDDARLLAFADVYQRHTGFHKLHPPV